jgi:hypothetical protein
MGVEWAAARSRQGPLQRRLASAIRTAGRGVGASQLSVARAGRLEHTRTGGGKTPESEAHGRSPRAARLRRPAWPQPARGAYLRSSPGADLETGWSSLRWSRSTVAACPALALVLACALSMADEVRTSRVERDRSGDFTTLQPALDAAARGDTVCIGPGRYDENAPFTTVGWTAETRAAVKVDSLVLIGTDCNAVVVGPAQFDGSAVDLRGIAMVRELTHLTVESLTVENAWHGLFAFGSASVRSATFRTCDSGIFALTPTGMQVSSNRCRVAPAGQPAGATRHGSRFGG